MMRLTRGIGVFTMLVVAASLGSTATAWATSNGVAAWGEDGLGQLGTPMRMLRYSPYTLKKPTGVTAMAGASWSTYALLESGAVEAWGQNWLGQLGDGATKESNTPVKVEGLEKRAVAVAAGENHAVALLENGTVETWGSNDTGQLCLGYSDHEPHKQAVPVPGVKEVIAIAAGGANTFLLTAHHTVLACGENESGQLGIGTVKEHEEECEPDYNPSRKVYCSTTPVMIPGLEEVTQVVASYGDTLALKNGEVWAWGSNESGQLGDGTTTEQRSPAKVPGFTGIVSVAAGSNFSFAIKEELEGKRVLYAWGDDVYGELGVGKRATGECWVGSHEYACSLTPLAVTELPEEVQAVSAADEHAMALMKKGTVEAWGANYEGELGIGAKSERTGGGSDKGPENCTFAGTTYACSRSPLQVKELHNVVGIMAAGDSSFAIGPPGRSFSG